MFLRRSFAGLALALGLWTLSSPAQAVRPHRGSGGLAAQQQADALRSKSVHVFRGLAPRDAGRIAKIEAVLGPVHVQFERADDRPARIALAGLSVPGAVSDAHVAELDARTKLNALMAELAPGSTAADFVLVTNHLDPTLGARTVAFAQHADGFVVDGGQLSFRYAHDRLVAVVNDSIALGPRTRATAQLSVADVDSRALAITAADRVYKTQGPMWFAKDRSGKSGARLVYVTEVRGRAAASANAAAPLRRRVVTDASSGELVANLDMLMWGTSPLRYFVPPRYPAGGRVAYPVRDAQVQVGGASLITDASGVLDYPGASSNFSHDLDGPYTRIDDSSGAFSPVAGPLNDGSAVTVNPLNDDLLDARLTTFIHTNIVKERVRQIAPGFDFVDEQLLANVNIADSCNAFWNGESMNFFVAGGGCENTGRLADVVYHEFGHGVHENAIIPGVGLMNVALSEGISDYLAATITDDPGMARGFFEGSDDPLRQLDPVGSEWTWPDDIGEVHDEGRIIGGAFWDLRQQLRAKYGEASGIRLTDRLWFAAVQRAYDIPSAYFEVLLADDDDGNLDNGTPNVCEISDAFGAHGLFRSPGGDGELLLDVADGTVRSELPLEIPFPQCNLSANAVFSWRDRENPDSQQSAPMQRVGDRWVIEVPAPPPGTVLQYAADVSWSNGTEEHLPHNLADRWLERYVGPVVELYCTSFEDGGNDGWTPFPPFEIGAPAAQPGAGDPQAAFHGEQIAGINLEGEGKYSPIVEQRLLSPTLELPPFAEIRLQYWRELDVEDGYWDQASILANGVQVWRNFGSSNEITATVHHRDEAWRFHDVDLTDALGPEGTLDLEFNLQADGGLEFGGWHVDSLCVVGVEGPYCGDGNVDPGEGCDDGNQAGGDGCDADCMVEPPPPPPTTTTTTSAGEVSTGEGTSETGDGGELSGIAARGCACALSDDQDPAPTGWLALGCLGLVGLRRRRRSSEAGLGR